MSLRVGVVGAGARSTLAKHVVSHDARLVAAVEPHPDAAARVAARLGENITTLPDVASLVSFGVDAAFVTSPDDTHRAVTIELLRAGIPVYLEKPLAITVPDADAILNAAFESGTRLYVGHNMRHMDVVRKLHSIIAEGLIGEVKAIWCRHFVGHGGDFYFHDWHATREHGTGLLLQKGAHDIDVIHLLANSSTREVTAMGDLMVYGDIADRADNSAQLMGDWFDRSVYPAAKQRGLNPVIDVEDISMMLMRLDSGVLASYQQCHFTPDYWRNYTVIGTEGRIENFGDAEGGHIKAWNHRCEWNPDGDRTWQLQGDEGHGEADELTVAEFMGFVRDGGHTDTNPLAARDAVAAGSCATESLRASSIPIRVPEVPAHIADYFEAGQVRGVNPPRRTNSNPPQGTKEAR